MVSVYDLASCGGLPVLIIWTLSTSGPSDDGSSWQINKPALQTLLPCFLVSTESVSQGEHPQGTDESEHLHLKRSQVLCVGTWHIMACSCPAAHWPSLWHLYHLPERKEPLLRCVFNGFSSLEKKILKNSN